jgi:rod shape determining protein RodA
VRRLDPLILLATLVIAVCSYLAQSSTARAIANPAYAHRQLIFLAVGFALLVIVSLADYRVLARFSPLLYAASLAVLLSVFVLAPLRAGTHAWLSFAGFTLQPSEFARIATILAVAALAGEHRRSQLDLGTVARIAAVVGVPALLVALEPDLGMALTYAPIVLAALWLGGLPLRAWLALAIAGLTLVAAAWLWYLKPYQKERILTFLDSARSPYAAGYQQRQSKIAVGSGRATGKGLHSGTQSHLRFLPAQHTDFIFAVWAEETGFVGASLLLAAFGLLLARILLIAAGARDRVGALVAGATGFVLATQTGVNVAFVTGLAPTTGITLPLMSSGGSSIIAICISLGLVQSVWRLRYANV